MPSSFSRVEPSTAGQQSREKGKDHLEALETANPETLKQAEALEERSHGKYSAEVAVGVSRLHMVSLPMLQMKPIYWSPVNDVAVVMRATWFYRLVFPAAT